MNKSNVTIRCAQCNRILLQEERPCPNCGSTKRHYSVEAQCTVGILTSSKIKLTISTGFVKLVSWARNKLSGASKRHTRESLTIDRSNLEFTRKLHRVEEVTETGEYKVVHDEDKKFPAKRHPQR